MGCGISKLKGDEFECVNSSVYPSVLVDKHEEPKVFTNNIGEAPSSAEGTRSFHAKLVAAKQKLVSSSNTPGSALAAPANSSSVSQKEALRENSEKLSTLRQQWKNRKGVPEPRDPVTGRGLHTGMTPEELKKYVESKTPALTFDVGGAYVA